MSTLKIYKDSHGVWFFGNQTVPAGSISLVVVDSQNNIVNFQSMTSNVVFGQNKNGHILNEDISVVDIIQSNGTPYGTISALLSVCTDFFVKAVGDNGNWLSLKGLLNQSGTSAPTLTILNSSDADYIGGNCILHRVEAGFYELFNIGIVNGTIMSVLGNNTTEPFFVNFQVYNRANIIEFIVGTFVEGVFTKADGLLVATPIEIKVPKRLG